MSDLNKQPKRRAAAGVLAGALAFTAGAFATGVSPAMAAPGFELSRVAGENRYQTSADTAAEFGAATEAILASGEVGRFPDALSANFLAGVKGAPVLLTQRDTTPAVILAALAASNVTTVTLIGGTDAISAAQETALRAAAYTVVRLGGRDRFLTSELVIGAGAAQAATIGIVTSGLRFPDALGAGPLAYSGKHPVGLVTRDSVPPSMLAAFTAAGVTQVLIVGGQAVVGPQVVAQLAAAGITVASRLAGQTRSLTSVEVANYLFANGFVTATFNVASGDDRFGGVDALGAAALSGKTKRALLITNTATDVGAVDDFATAKRATLNTGGRIFGGPAAVATAVEVAVETAGVGP